MKPLPRRIPQVRSHQSRYRYFSLDLILGMLEDCDPELPLENCLFRRHKEAR